MARNHVLFVSEENQGDFERWLVSFFRTEAIQFPFTAVRVAKLEAPDVVVIHMTSANASDVRLAVASLYKLGVRVVILPANSCERGVRERVRQVLNLRPRCIFEPPKQSEGT